MNQQKYGIDTPPAYDLTKITTPIHLYHSKDDNTAVVNAVMRLKYLFPNLQSTYLVPWDDFSHVDFTYSRNARLAVNDKLINNMNKANHIN